MISKVLLLLLSLRHRVIPVGLLTAVVAVLATTPALAADACPNAAIRAVQGTSHLPDCRALEQVTPVEKGIGGVDSFQQIQGADQPGGIAFSSSNAYPGSPANIGISTLRSTRTASGWVTKSVDLPQTNPFYQLVRPTKWLSDDLRYTIGTSLQALAPGSVEGEGNLYVNDVDTDQRTLIVQTPPETYPSVFIDFTTPETYPVIASNADLSHVLFQSADPNVLSDATDGQGNLYELVDGTLRLVNRMPDGSPSILGAAARGVASARDSHPMSADGSKIFFTINDGSGGGTLYMREDGTTTTLISHSQRTGDDPTVPVDDMYFEGATGDGRYAYFETGQHLTDDVFDPDTNANLYRYDTETGLLTLVAKGDTPAVGNSYGGVYSFLGASDVGDRAYFISAAKLTADAVSGQMQLYVSDHGEVELAADLDTQITLAVAMSSDGRYAGFTAYGDPTGEGAPSPACSGSPNGHCSEAYLYDAVNDTLDCVSCPDQGDSQGGATVMRAGEAHVPRAMLDDGTLFFSTANALVAGDVNAKVDVYQSKQGVESLISTGTDSRDAAFRDASTDGTDVYFVTSGGLVAQDLGGSMDLYSARREGGLEAQNDPPAPATDCAGDACQGPGTAAPGQPDIGTLAFDGPSDSGRAPSVRVSALRSVVGSVAILRVRVSGPGRISVSGASVRTARKIAGRAATYRLKVRLTKRAKARFGKAKRITARLRVAYRPSGGSTAAKTMTVSFKKAGGR